MPRLIAIIVIPLDLFLYRTYRFASPSILLRGRSRYLIYLIRVSFGLLNRNILSLGYYSLSFLRSAAGIIVQTRSLLDQLFLIRGKALDYHYVFNIRPQILIEPGHLGAFVPVNPRRVLCEPSKVLGYRCRLLKFHELQLRGSDLVQVAI
jgi:hypothetical protein